MLPEAGTRKYGRRSTDKKPTLVTKEAPATSNAKVLAFPGGAATGVAAGTGERRRSWSSRAGVSDRERLVALATGALIAPAIWAGHALLVWMHVL